MSFSLNAVGGVIDVSSSVSQRREGLWQPKVSVHFSQTVRDLDDRCDAGPLWSVGLTPAEAREVAAELCRSADWVEERCLRYSRRVKEVLS